MATDPRDSALLEVFRATVRVANGSGVVIWPSNSPLLIATAAHVVRTGENHLVRRGAVFDECPVITRDDRLDLALLRAPQGLEKVAIEVADETTDALPGDPIWTAGFPRGWDGPDPVVAAGTIASLGLECWVNVDGSWGDSGGPLCRALNGRAVLVGNLLGNTKGVSKALEDWVRMFGEDAGAARLALEGLRERHSALSKEAVAEMTKPLKIDALLGKLDPSSPTVQIKLLTLMHAHGSTALARLIEDHFRTGFLRFGPVAGIRKLLG
jgi:hypothetical protein